MRSHNVRQDMPPYQFTQTVFYIQTPQKPESRSIKINEKVPRTSSERRILKSICARNEDPGQNYHFASPTNKKLDPISHFRRTTKTPISNPSKEPRIEPKFMENPYILPRPIAPKSEPRSLRRGQQ